MITIKNRLITKNGLYLFNPTKITNCNFFNIEGDNHHGAEVHGPCINQPDPMYIFSECVFDNEGIEPDAYDEGVALVNAPSVLFYRCRFAHWGKAVLVGNGDHSDADKDLRVTFNECIFEHNGRRSPYIQFGKATLNNCLIKDWGDPDYFYLKSHGLRVGKEASCEVNNSVFVQENFWPGNIKTFFKDVFNQYSPILLPGNCRGAYAEKGGNLTINHCYKNSMFVWFSAKNNDPMSKEEAEEKIKYLETVVPKK